MTRPTPEAALLASLAQLGAECDEQQARFVRCCGELGAEIGRRQRAERRFDELLACLVDLLGAADSVIEDTAELDPPPFEASLLEKARAAVAAAAKG